MAALALDTPYNFADYYAAKIRVSTLAGDSTTRINVVFKYPTTESPTLGGGNLTGGGSGGATTPSPDFTQGIQANGTVGELVIQWSKADNKIRGSRNSAAGAPVDIPWLSVTGVKFQFTSDNTAAVVTAPVAQVITFALPTKQVTDDDGVVITVPVKLIETLDLITENGAIAILTRSVPVELSASSTSGLTTFIFTSSDITAATITDGDVLTYLDGKKTAVITASQSGNDHWLPATATITLAPKTLKTQQTVTLSITTKSLSIGQSTTFTASATSGLPVTVTTLDPSIVSISGNNLVGVSPGPSIIYAEQGGDSTYEAANTDGVLVIVKKTPQTLTFPTDLSGVKVGDQLQLTASSSSGLPVTLSSSDDSVATVSEDAVLYVRSQGAADITAFQAGSDIYDEAQVTKTVTIGSSSQVISFPEMSEKPFGAPPFTLVASASSNLPLTYSSSKPLVASIFEDGSVLIVGVGSTFITASQEGNSFWDPAISVQRLLMVVKAEQSILLSSPPSQISISERVLLKGASTSGSPVVFFVSGSLSIDGDYITGTASGPGTVTATAAGDVNYNPASLSFDVAVGAQPQEIVFPSIEPRTFNFRFFSLKASATSGLPVSFSSSAPAVASVTPLGEVTVNKAGVSLITASQEGDLEWLPATSLQRWLVIDKGDQQISFLPPSPVPSTQVSVVLSASAPGGAVVFTSSNPQVVEMSGNVALIKGLGAARIVVTQEGTPDYMPAVAVMPIFVVPLLDSVTAPLNSILDLEPHTMSVSPPTGAVAVAMAAPTTLDSEVHNSLLISLALNKGEVVPPNTVLDQSAFTSREVSTVFTGASKVLVTNGADHETYLAGGSPAFSGTSVVMPVSTEQDLSSYGAATPSAPKPDSDCVGVKYDGRDLFETYQASLPKVLDGYLLIAAGSYLLLGRTNEDGVFISGKLIL